MIEANKTVVRRRLPPPLAAEVGAAGDLRHSRWRSPAVPALAGCVPAKPG